MQDLIARLRQDSAEMREYAAKCGQHALDGIAVDEERIAARWAQLAHRSARYALDLEQAADALEFCRAKLDRVRTAVWRELFAMPDDDGGDK